MVGIIYRDILSENIVLMSTNNLLRGQFARKPIEKDINHKIIDKLNQFRNAEQLEKAKTQLIQAADFEKAQNELFEAKKRAEEAAAAKQMAEAAATKSAETEDRLKKEQSNKLEEASAAKAKKLESVRKIEEAEQARKEALAQNNKVEAEEAAERAKQAELERTKAIEEEARLQQEAAEKKKAIEAEKLEKEKIEAEKLEKEKIEAIKAMELKKAEEKLKKAALKKQLADKAAQDAKTKIYKASVTLKIGSDSDVKHPLYVETPIKVEYTSLAQISDIDESADVIVSTNASNKIDQQLQTIINNIKSGENTDLKEAYESEEYYSTLQKYENSIASNPPNASGLNMFTITVKYDIYLNGQEELRLKIKAVIPNKSEPLTGKPISKKNKENLSFQSKDPIFTENAGIAYENPSNEFNLVMGAQGGKHRTTYKYNKKNKQTKKKNYKKKQSKKHTKIQFKKQRKSRH
jgi:hypothetical protein